MNVILVEDGILVTWYFLHTGASDIDLIEILFREDIIGTSIELVSGGNISRPENDTFLISGSYLQAGLSYQVAVRASNEFGVSRNTLSEILQSPVGMFNRSQIIYTNAHSHANVMSAILLHT